MHPNDLEKNDIDQFEIDTEDHSNDIDNDYLAIDLDDYSSLDELLRDQEEIDESPDIILDTVPSTSRTNTAISRLSVKKKAWLLIFFICLCIVLTALAWFKYTKVLQNKQSNSQQPTVSVVEEPDNSDEQKTLSSAQKDAQNKDSQINQPVHIKLNETLLVRPPEGENNILTDSQIGWCLYQKLRIDTLRTSVKADNAIISVNNETEAYNKRCGMYQYSQDSLSLAQSNLARHHDKIVSDAKHEAGKLDKKALAIAVTTQINPGDLPFIETHEHSPEYNQQKQFALFPNNECALILKKTFNFNIAKNFASTKVSNKKLIRIYRMKDGAFAVAIGFIKPNKMYLVEEWKKAGKLAQNTQCLNNSYFVQDVTKAKANELGLVELESDSYDAVKNKAQINAQADYGYESQQSAPNNSLGNESFGQPYQRRQIQPQNSYNQPYQNNNYNDGYNQNRYANNAHNQSNNYDNSYNGLSNNQTPSFQPQRTISKGNGLDTGSFKAGSYENIDPEKNLKELNNLFSSHGGSIHTSTDTQTSVTTLSSSNIQSTDSMVNAPTKRANPIQNNSSNDLAAIDALKNGRGVTRSSDVENSEQNNSVSLADSSTPPVTIPITE